MLAMIFFHVNNSAPALAVQPILDTPDGVWSLDVKRDIFDKIGGSVRSTSLIANASYYYKVYIAIASVLAEMDLESNLLMVRGRNLTQTLIYIHQKPA